VGDFRDRQALTWSSAASWCDEGSNHMSRRGTSLAITAAVLIAFWLIWSRLRIVVFVQANFWQIILLFLVLAVVLFLGIDHLLNRTR
jgi:hypothetical protein